jgi:hypothetical protein
MRHGFSGFSQMQGQAGTSESVRGCNLAIYFGALREIIPGSRVNRAVLQAHRVDWQVLGHTANFLVWLCAHAAWIVQSPELYDSPTCMPEIGEDEGCQPPEPTRVPARLGRSPRH